MRVLVVPSGDDTYAVPLRAAREVLPAPAVTPIPDAPTVLAGVFNHRGDVLPVLDLAALLGGAPLADAGYVLVAGTEHGPAGFAVAERGESATLGRRLGASEHPAADGHHEAGEHVVTLLDLDALVGPLVA
jgi:purine-binding chemotaxis protein CheW